MRKLFTLLLCFAAAPVMANEYGDYDEYSDDYIATCPVCDCGDSSARDNYVGFRVYKNEHAAYAYTLSNGHKEKEKRDNFGFGTTVGNRLTDNIRVEFETLYMGTQYSRNDKDFEYDIWANMLNAYLFRNFGGAVEPYAGLGLGLTGIWGEIDGQLDNAFDLSYQAMVGILFQLNKRIDLDIGFKYINFGKVEHSRGVSKVDATQLYVGATYKFDL